MLICDLFSFHLPNRLGSLVTKVFSVAIKGPVQITLLSFYVLTGSHRNARLAKLGKTKLAR